VGGVTADSARANPAEIPTRKVPTMPAALPVPVSAAVELWEVIMTKSALVAGETDRCRHGAARRQSRVAW